MNEPQNPNRCPECNAPLHNSSDDALYLTKAEAEKTGRRVFYSKIPCDCGAECVRYSVHGKKEVT